MNDDAVEVEARTADDDHAATTRSRLCTTDDDDEVEATEADDDHTTSINSSDEHVAARCEGHYHDAKRRMWRADGVGTVGRGRWPASGVRRGSASPNGSSYASLRVTNNTDGALRA